MSQLGPDPTLPSEFQMPHEPPSWPKVVGIISICWGSLFILCNTCNLLGSVVSGALVNMVPPEQREQMQQQMAAGRTPMAMVSAALGLLLSGFLIFAGVQTVRRLAIGRMLHLIWVAGSVLIGVLGGAIGWMQMKTNLAQTLQNDPNAARAAGAATGMAYIMFGCIMIFVFIWPLFCLVWFGPMGKRPEAGWAGEEPLV